MRVCCGALHGEHVRGALAAIRASRGSVPPPEASPGGTPLGALVQTTSRVAKLVEAMRSAHANGGDKVDVRWRLCWRETQYSKVYAEAVRAHKEDPQLLAMLDKVHKSPNCKDKLAWEAAKAKWQKAVDVPLAQALLSLGFDPETAALLCPSPTRKEQVIAALAERGIDTKPAQGCAGSALERLRRLSSVEFPLLDAERVTTIAQGSDTKGRRGQPKE